MAKKAALSDLAGIVSPNRQVLNPALQEEEEEKVPEWTPMTPPPSRESQPIRPMPMPRWPGVNQPIQTYPGTIDQNEIPSNLQGLSQLPMDPNAPEMKPVPVSMPGRTSPASPQKMVPFSSFRDERDAMITLKGLRR